MCLIIHKPAHKQIDRDALARAARNNSDGIGLVRLLPDGKFVTSKAVPTSPAHSESVVLAWIDQIDASEELAIHLRMRTHGPVNVRNTHPFSMTDAFLMHNGIIRKYGGTKDLSDTAQFFAEFAKPCLQAVATDDDFDDLATWIREEAGDFNRFLIYKAGRGIKRIGHWTEHEGVFYSNDASLRSTWFGWPNTKWYSADDKVESAYSKYLPSLPRRDAKDRSRLESESGLVPTIYDESEVYDLQDLIGWSYQELHRFARNDPQYFADLVCRHLEAIEEAQQCEDTIDLTDAADDEWTSSH